MIKTAIVIPDRHIPLHDESACNIVLQAIEMIKPDIFIDLGDVGEWESVSHWRYKRRKRPPLEYQLPLINEEIKQVNDELDKWDKALAKVGCEDKRICTGNHDIWLDDFVEEYPYLKDYTFNNVCRWKERGFRVYEHNEPVKIGKLVFIHGVYTTVYHARQHLSAYGTSIAYGHVHDVQSATQTKLDSGTIGSWALGCLKDMSREKNRWLKGKLHNWKHCFGIVYFYPNGNFRLETVDIVKGKTVLWGKELEG